MSNLMGIPTLTPEELVHVAMVRLQAGLLPQNQSKEGFFLESVKDALAILEVVITKVEAGDVQGSKK